MGSPTKNWSKLLTHRSFPSDLCDAGSSHAKPCSIMRGLRAAPSSVATAINFFLLSIVDADQRLNSFDHPLSVTARGTCLRPPAAGHR